MADLALLRRLLAAFPVPGAAWHAWAEAIGEVHADLEAAVGVAGEHPAVPAAAPAAAAGTLAAARARLAALPRPDGRHPYLDEIEAALAALGGLLGRIAAVPAAADAFAHRRDATPG